MWYRRFRTLAVLASAGLLFQMFLPSVVAGELADKSDPPPLAPYPATWAFRIALAEPGESVVGLIYGTASVGGDGTGTYTGTIEETGATPSPISGTISMSVDPSGNTVVIDTTDPEFSVPMDNGITVASRVTARPPCSSSWSASAAATPPPISRALGPFTLWA